MTNDIAEKPAKFPMTGIWWACLDFARSPSYYVVFIYIFATYFAEVVIADSAKGQTIISSTMTMAGLIMAMIAPFLGGYMDRGGAKKPVLGAIFILYILSLGGLAFVYPGVSYAVPLGMVLLVMASCSFALSELFHNALLPTAGPSSTVPMISGLGLSMGSFAAVMVLLLIIYFLQSPPFGLTQTDISRLSGTLCAVWMAIFIIPFFLGSNDNFKEGAQWRTAKFFPKKWTPIKAVEDLFGEHSIIMRFLVARMIFMDGLTALYTIGAVYVAGVFGWSTSEVAAMGIIATCSAVFGGLLGGILDNRFSPKNAILIELIAITLIFCFQISMTPESILFGLVELSAETADRTLFNRSSDVIYLIAIVPLTAFIIAAYSSCRSLLVALSPKEEIGRFFGIYAMTNTVTIWLGPALVTGVTFITQSQRLGFASLIILFVAGIIAMARISNTEVKAQYSV